MKDVYCSKCGQLKVYVYNTLALCKRCDYPAEEQIDDTDTEAFDLSDLTPTDPIGLPLPLPPPPAAGPPSSYHRWYACANCAAKVYYPIDYVANGGACTGCGGFLRLIP